MCRRKENIVTAVRAASLLGLQKKSLREQALSALRTAISSGALKPGQHLVETELSTMLQISRGTLREALRQLEQEGLLSAGPRGRLFVRRLDVKKIQGIYATRAALESLAIRTLCELAERRHVLHSLRVAIDAMEVVTKDSLEKRIELDLEFHHTVCRLTGNETLLHSWEALEGSIRMSIMFGAGNGMKNMGANRHHHLVDLVEAGEASRAEAAIIEHINSAAANLVA